MALDVSQVKELVANDGYEAMFESYDAAPIIYPLLGRIIDPSDAGVPLYGDKGTVYMGHQRPLERLDGQEVKQSTSDEAYSWQCAIKQYSRGLRLPSRLLRSQGEGANRAVKAQVLEWAQDVGQVSALTKDDHIAGMFQKGTLTAGSAQYFDQTYVGNADSNPTVIYDGQPWFDTAHTVAGSGSTYANHVVSAALTSATLQTGITTMSVTNAVNDRGDRISIRPNILLVPGGLRFTAETILNSALLPGSANNDVNPVAGALTLIPWAALTDAASAASWWLGQAGRGLRIYDSGAPRLWVVQEDNGDITINYEYTFGACVDQWRYWYCGNKAAS
jgi:hypothetical protein